MTTRGWPRRARETAHDTAEATGNSAAAWENGPGRRRTLALLPWLLMGLGGLSNLVQGKTPNPWVGAGGLLLFNGLYISVVARTIRPTLRREPTFVALAGLGTIAFALAGLYGGSWLLFLPLFGLACGTVLRGRFLVGAGLVIGAGASVLGLFRGGASVAVGSGYGTFISMMVTSAIMTLSETVRELRSTRQELARAAVEQERLRFSRDLHDLLGHTLSVIVVKAEAARRLARGDVEAALTQVSDIEAVGRQALTEVREAVTGYREGSLAGEFDRAVSVLNAAGVEPVVRRSGTPLEPQAEALLGWVVREAVTNVVRHSAATRCEIVVDASGPTVTASVTDNGVGAHPDLVGAAGGSGLKGLTERLAAAGGSLETGGAMPGFRVTATLPADAGGTQPAVASGETGPVPLTGGNGGDGHRC